MELQICVLFTTLVVCGAEIRPAGWLDKVVAHWKKSFIDDFEQLGPFNLDASIEPAPPGYKDSPDWDFDSVSRMLALLSVSETGQPTLNSLRRMIAPSRRMMADVPGLAASYIPQSLYNNRRSYYLSGPDRRGMRKDRKRPSHNRMRTNNQKDMAGNRMGMANNRKGMAYERKGIQGNRVQSRKQMLEKRIIEKELSEFQKSFRWFPSIRDQVPNNIYYDEERDSYEDATAEYEFIDPLAPKEEAIVLLRNPVEARLPSARISVKLLKEILEARAVAARVMPAKKKKPFSWKPVDMTTPSNNGTSDDNSTAAADSIVKGSTDNANIITVGGGGVAATTPGAGGGGGDDALTTVAAGDAGGEPAEAPPVEARKMAAKDQLGGS